MNTETAIFASGCFWGTEYYFRKARGVISTAAGYTGGHTDNPAYHDVSAGGTGHAEAVEVTFDPAVTSYKNLVKVFFEARNPYRKSGQGLNIRKQYRSAIFYLDDKQKGIAEDLIKALEEKGGLAATEVTKAGTFWKAEDRHQDYYNKRGGNPYCRISGKSLALKEQN